ncbi:MAG: sigma-54-dependent Fis family transcriptional regulator, partial [Planctomycetes bacterium]|nr:sigma-54-dependent Fis family transcriptional regulator [Planctomycetota bacterium]
HCRVKTCDYLESARRRATEQHFDAVVFALDDAGVDLASIIADWCPCSAVVVTCDERQCAQASKALGSGLANFLCDGFDPHQAAATLRAVAEAHMFRGEFVRVTTRANAAPASEFHVGMSPAMRRLDSAIRRACEIDATVLIEGAAGTGKSLVANTLHLHGRRSTGPLVTAYGADLTEERLDAALEDASGGTLVIEHIEHLPSRSQSRLVRVLKERGSDDDTAARIIATTQGRLAELTAGGSFREDLFYRLNIFPMQMPLLRERTEDIPALADVFLRQASVISGTQAKGFSPAAMVLLETNPWPGNVSQLRNAVFRAHVLAGRKAIDRVHLMGPAIGVQAPPEVKEMRAPKDETDEVRESDILPFQEEEKRILSRALRAAKGNVRKAAELLGIGRATLYRKIQIFELSLS